MRVLVTGAGGFLGCRVVQELLDRGHAVRALVRPTSPIVPQEWGDRAEIVRADLRTASALDELFDGIDVLVHLAATVRGTPEAQFVGTVVGTERLLEGMRLAGTTKRIVLAGSCAAYDWTAAKRVLHEDTPLERRLYERDGYTVAKTWQERVARRCAAENDWKLTVLRPGFIYGPRAVPAGGAGIYAGRLFLVVAPFARLRLTHVVNCAAAFADAAERGGDGTFNIIDEERVSAWRYAGRLLQSSRGVLRVPLPYFVGLGIAHLGTITSRVLFPPRGGKLPGVLKPRHFRARFKPLKYDTRRAREVLGWRSKSIFKTGCDVT